ncbi:MAG: hypothetical protein DRJ03_03320 [Chloroflexi bacterium]|nr:MAG: hypothetical protein DRJ03_03320 [Chloroflexota bacterium]
MGKYEENDPLDRFLSGVDEQVPETRGPDLSRKDDFAPAHLPKSIMAVYSRLGGDSWLLKIAEEYPKEFLKLLTKIMPAHVEHQIINSPDLLEMSLEEVEAELFKRDTPPLPLKLLPGKKDKE